MSIQPATYLVEITNEVLVNTYNGSSVRVDAQALVPVDVPPLISEILAWLDDDPDHFVEQWVPTDGEWLPALSRFQEWQNRLRNNGDQRQPGYRIPTAEATDRLVVSERLDEEPEPVAWIVMGDGWVSSFTTDPDTAHRWIEDGVPAVPLYYAHEALR